MKSIRKTLWTAAWLLGLVAICALPGAADQVILDDLIVDGSACVGNDCVNGESFGFDTLRLKENNLRIHFDDTSNSASFPTANWRIVINDSSNGGGKYFAVEDSDSGYRSFTVEQGAGSNALYVDNGGEIGFGTNNPVADLHVKSGNTPTLRLEQDGSSGFAAQTWDVAGNEANFFIRDATNGSTLPLRIFPGAPSNALNIEASGDIGLGTNSPTRELHVQDSDATTVLVESTGASNAQLRLLNTAAQWDFRNNSIGNFTLVEGGSNEVAVLDSSGNLTIDGGLVTTGGGGACTSVDPCDGVFSPEFEVEPIEEHAAYMWSNRHLKGIGPTAENGPINITRKTGGLINELEKAHIYIEQLHKRLEKLEKAAAESAEK